MPKTVSLKELPDFYIKSGMSIDELAEYLCTSKYTLKNWEKYFHLFPENPGEDREYYSKRKIQDFIKIKAHLDKGKTLQEIKTSFFGNPFVETQKVPEFDMSKLDEMISERQAAIVNPFLTQLTMANERIGSLIMEKASIIEEAAIEKASLLTEVNVLKDKNQMLIEEKGRLEFLIKEKEDLLRKSSTQEISLGVALRTSQELLKDKEEEISRMKSQINYFENEIEQKNGLIQSQEAELNKILAKKWWQVWK